MLLARMNNRKWRHSLGFALAFAACLGFAHAQTPGQSQVRPPAKKAAKTKPPARASAQSHFDKGEALRVKGDFAGAARAFYAALEELRRQNRGGTTDAGKVFLYLARALKGLDHKQTDEAYERAMDLLTTVDDAKLFLIASLERLDRLAMPAQHAHADALVTRMLERVKASGVDDEQRLEAIAFVLSFFRRAGAKDDEPRAIALAHALDGTSMRAAEFRGRARLERARAHHKEGLMAEASIDYEGAIADLRRAEASDNAELLGVALYKRGEILREEGLFQDALPFLEAADPLLAAGANDENYLLSGRVYMTLLSNLERRRDALATAERRVQWAQERHGVDSRPAIEARLDRVAMLLRVDDREEAGRKLEEERARLATAPFGAGMEASFFEKLAALHLFDENYKDAASAAERAIAAARNAASDDPLAIVVPMRQRADASKGLRDPALAERAFSDLIIQSQTAWKPEHPEVARDLHAFASYLQDFGRRQEAEPLYRRSLAILERAYGARGLKFAMGLHNLAVLVASLNKFDEAIDMYKQVLEICGDFVQNRSLRAQTLINLASTYDGAARGEEALVAAEEAARLLKQEKTPDERAIFLARIARVAALSELGRLPEAWQAGLEALRAANPRTEEDNFNLVAAHGILADVAKRGGQPRVALDVVRKARELEVNLGLSDRALSREVAILNVIAALAVAGD